jgi:hypothetical protein
MPCVLFLAWCERSIRNEGSVESGIECVCEVVGERSEVIYETNCERERAQRLNEAHEAMHA